MKFGKETMPLSEGMSRTEARREHRKILARLDAEAREKFCDADEIMRGALRGKKFSPEDWEIIDKWFLGKNNHTSAKRFPLTLKAFMQGKSAGDVIQKRWREAAQKNSVAIQNIARHLEQNPGWPDQQMRLEAREERFLEEFLPRLTENEHKPKTLIELWALMMKIDAVLVVLFYRRLNSPQILGERDLQARFDNDLPKNTPPLDQGVSPDFGLEASEELSVRARDRIFGSLRRLILRKKDLYLRLTEPVDVEFLERFFDDSGSQYKSSYLIFQSFLHLLAEQQALYALEQDQKMIRIMESVGFQIQGNLSGVTLERNEKDQWTVMLCDGSLGELSVLGSDAQDRLNELIRRHTPHTVRTQQRRDVKLVLPDMGRKILLFPGERAVPSEGDGKSQEGDDEMYGIFTTRAWSSGRKPRDGHDNNMAYITARNRVFAVEGEEPEAVDSQEVAKLQDICRRYLEGVGLSNDDMRMLDQAEKRVMAQMQKIGAYPNMLVMPSSEAEEMQGLDPEAVIERIRVVYRTIVSGEIDQEQALWDATSRVEREQKNSVVPYYWSAEARRQILTNRNKGRICSLVEAVNGQGRGRSIVIPSGVVRYPLSKAQKQILREGRVPEGL